MIMTGIFSRIRKSLQMKDFNDVDCTGRTMNELLDFL